MRSAWQLAVKRRDVYVNTWSSTYTEMKNAPGRFVAFRDADRDGHAEVIERFGTVVYQEGKAGVGTGIGVYGKPAYLFNPARLVALTAARCPRGAG